MFTGRARSGRRAANSAAETRARDSRAARVAGEPLFEELALPALDDLYRFACRLERDPARAADLLQDALVTGLRKFPQLGRPASFRSWMTAIVHRTFLNRHRRSARLATLEDRDGGGALPELAAAAAAEPDRRLPGGARPRPPAGAASPSGAGKGVGIMNADGCHRARSAIEGLRSTGVDLPDEVALHLDGCTECRSRFDAGRVELDGETFERLGEPSRGAIIGALAQAHSAARRRRASAVVAAVSAAAALAAVMILIPGSSPSGGAEVGSALVEDHIRYLRDPSRRSAAEPAAVVADLEGHVDFPVRLPTPAASRLTGGRRCYLLGRRAALAFYDTPAGPVSYFAFEAGELRPPGRACPGGAGLSCQIETGYRIVSWEEAGLLYAVVGPDGDALVEVATAARRTLQSR